MINGRYKAPLCARRARVWASAGPVVVVFTTTVAGRGPDLIYKCLALTYYNLLSPLSCVHTAEARTTVVTRICAPARAHAPFLTL